MDPLVIFLTQLTLSLAVWIVVARYLVLKPLDNVAISLALSLLLIPHMLRHLGLSFLVPGVVGSAMPDAFATTAGYGDLMTAGLAMIAFLSLQWHWRYALVLVGIANIVGIVDLANALRQAEAVPHFGAAWYIPTFYVPILLVTHALMVRILYRNAMDRIPVFDA